MRQIALLLALLLFTGFSFAQKRAMTVEDTKTWNRISNRAISPNGEYVTYKIAPNKGDSKLYLYEAQKDKTHEFDRGKSAKLGYSNNLLLFKIAPQADSLRAKKLKKVKKKNLPKDSLAIYLFETDSLIKVEKVKSYCLPQKNSEWLAYTFDYKAPKDTTSKDTTATDSLTAKTDSLKTKPFKQEGHRLVILNTKSLEQYVYDNIESVTASENGNIFTFNQQVKDSVDTAKVFMFDVSQAKKHLCFEKAGEIKHLSIDNKGEKLSFLHSPDTGDVKRYALHLYTVKNKQSKILVDTLNVFASAWGASKDKAPYFSKSGQRLYFGLAPFDVEEPEDSLLDEEKVRLDIWSWTDKRLQPHQLKKLKEDAKLSFLSYYDFKTKAFVQLEDEEWRTKLNEDVEQKYYLSFSRDKYLKMLSWDVDYYKDYAVVDAKTGKRSILAEQKVWRTYVSPSGNYTVVWDKASEQWSIYDNKSLKHQILTEEKIDLFAYQNHDTPSKRGSHGFIGFSEDEKYVYLNSQFDIWKFDTKCKSKPVNLTKGLGKKTKTEYRYQNLDREADYLPSKEWMLHAFDTEKMDEGYYILNLNDLSLKTLIKESQAFMPPKKAKEANKMIWAQSDFSHYPEVKYSGMDFKNAKTLSHANPQQKDINWGKISLTQWTDFKGDSLKGLLVLPEDFDPNKKYPVIIYFYEKYSNLLYNYWTPRPSHSTISFSFYASNGYIVFVPDINYGTGLPGKDAYDAIVSGTQHISHLPFVNTEKIGIQGQSWGGYQVAYLVTQTDLYACGMAGAPVSNMTSAYGGIRWESGMSRMFQYEHTQSRIGGTLWNKRDKYIENSPVFFADRVNTPLLMMHNDKDGAVPWYQGIEYFVALRRLNKPAWLLNYNGDGHNLMKWPNRVDLTIRMFGFFEHYLKDKPMPEWMEKGLPAVKKGKELRY